MREHQSTSMIGSLLFYALYPLSRVLAAGRRSEATQRRLPSAVVDGTAAWDGGSVSTRRFTPSQTTLLDQWLRPTPAAAGETEERMKEQSPAKEEDTDREQPVSVPRGQPQKGLLKTAEVQPDKREVPERERTCEVQHGEPNTEDACVGLTEDVRPEPTGGAHLKCPQTDDSTEETTCPGQQQIQTPDVGAAVPPSAADKKPTERWDEYCAVHADDAERGGARSPQLALASLLANTPTRLRFSGQHDEHAGWHFPAGPGLAEEVQCPLWQFPAGSYYPPTESTVPFEVMWRVWQETDESAPAAEPAMIPFPLTKASMDFTVMSYNILAQDLLEVNQELYIHCPLEVLDWSYRCRLLLEEIQKWTPDILCLQEVQENHYYEQLYPTLCQMGYTCAYKRRTGTKTDGCATCYRSSRFSEVSVSPLEFFRPHTELLDRHNVAIVALLRPVLAQGCESEAKAPLLCVANTHLLFNPRRGDVKLAQLAMMLAEVDGTVKSCRAKGERCNVILCGDFNSVPHMPLYQLVTTGELYYQGLPSWMISGQEDLSYKTHCYRLFAPLWPSCLGITDDCQYATVGDVFDSQKSGTHQYSHDLMRQLRYCPAACIRPVDLKLIPGVTDNTPDASRENQTYEKSFRHTISHPLHLESVYKHVLPGSGTPEVTTLHSEAGATVDYIFYSPRRILTSDQKVDGDFVSEGLKLIGSLSLLSEDVLWSINGLPSHTFPSDHLSLVAKFQLDLNAAR